jgi:hypothetical protein
LTHLGKFAKCDPNYCYDDNEENEDEENERRMKMMMTALGKFANQQLK